MPGEIRNLEIFAAGSWTTSNGTKVTISDSDIGEIVNNFNALQGTNVVKPHLKLGHQDAQKWFGQKTGIPTLGWIDKVWQVGSKLYADISHVPNSLIDLIQQKRYHNVSAEIFPKDVIEYEGKKIGPVLSAVAILGTEMPAVKDLAGLASALFANQFTSGVDKTPDNFTKDQVPMFTQEQVDALIGAAVTKAVGEATAKFSADQANFTTQLEVVTARAVAAEKQATELEGKFAAVQVDSIIDAAIKDGKILPAQKDMVKAFADNLGNGPIKFGGKEITPIEHFSNFIKSFGKQVDLKEKGSGSNSGGGGNFSNAAEEVDFKVRDAMKSNPKIQYAEAFKSILSADEDLKQRYAEGSS